MVSRDGRQRSGRQYSICRESGSTRLVQYTAVNMTLLLKFVEGMHWKLFPSVPGRLSHTPLHGSSFNTSVTRVYEVFIRSYAALS